MWPRTVPLFRIVSTTNDPSAAASAAATTAGRRPSPASGTRDEPGERDRDGDPADRRDVTVGAEDRAHRREPDHQTAGRAARHRSHVTGALRFAVPAKPRWSCGPRAHHPARPGRWPGRPRGWPEPPWRPRRVSGVRVDLLIGRPELGDQPDDAEAGNGPGQPCAAGRCRLRAILRLRGYAVGRLRARASGRSACPDAPLGHHRLPSPSWPCWRRPAYA